MAALPPQPTLEIKELDEVVERLAAASGTKLSTERRGAKRYPFPFVQKMAPYDHTGLPSRSRFQRVYCQDLSSSGISFFWPRIPDFEYIVMALETAGPPIYLTARVASVRPAPSHPNHLLVGCQFTGRVTTY